MLPTRKIGQLIRGKTTPFQMLAACILASMLGFLPGFAQAPGLSLVWIFLILILNANLYLGGIMLLLSKLVFWLTLPLSFFLGRLLIEGPLQGLFKSIVNAPVAAYLGFDYYVAVGGQILGIVFGVAIGVLLTRSLSAYRKKMISLSNDSERYKKWASKPWMKVMTFVFLGKGKGKKSYEELLGKKVGNPIRIWGVGVVVVVGVSLYLGASFFSESFLTSLAKKNLEEVNGATVDLESADLSLKEGKLEIAGLALADPQALDTNLFQANRIVADLDLRDLLRKRFTIDKISVDDAATGSTRDRPGSLKGPKPEEDKGPAVELPDYDDLEGILSNAKVWKERLAQAKRLIERFSSEGNPEEAVEGEKKLTWDEELDRRIRAEGYTNVRADYLIEGSPSLLIREFEALKVKTPYLGGMLLNILGHDLSSQPALVESLPRIEINSGDDRLVANLSLGEPAGIEPNALSLSLKDLDVDSLASSVKSDKISSLSGGNVDLSINGRIGARDNDLLASLLFEGTTLSLSGNPVSLDGVTIPIQVKGALDRPGIKVDSKVLQNLVVAEGKKKLLGKALDKLGVKDEGETESGEEKKPEDSLKEEAAKRLKGLFK